MKWYYKWKLRKIQAEIASLKEQTASPLIDNYTPLLRLRSLHKLAGYLEQRLAG